MATAQSRIELVLEVRNRIRSGLSQARSQIRGEIGEVRGRLSEFASNARNSFQSVANEIPLIGSGLKGLLNPMALTATAISGIGFGMMKAADRAAAFNSHFRDLVNLNLTRTKDEIKDLRDLVLDTAWKKGFSADETSTAYNDIQSTIGTYGREARAIVEKQGEFAKLMKADMNQWVAGTAKAMANWRFGNDRLDDFNKSGYAAMQVGVVSFEELAKVQSVFAGSAASAKQDFDTANKLFALFTVKTKSPDIAASQTRSLFDDLTKKNTIEAFKKIGINFYNMNGKIKQADEIMLELNKKFIAMKDDKSIITLKNQFAGSQGLIAMINAATDRSGELKKTFEEFTDTKFNFDNALSHASEDVLYRQEQLSNRIDNLVIRLGQIALPIKEKLVGVAEKFVDNVDFYVMKDEKDRQNAFVNRAKEDVKTQYANYYENLNDLTEKELNERLDTLYSLSKKYMQDYRDKTNSYLNDNFWNYSPIALVDGKNGKLEYKDSQNNYDRHFDLGKSKGLSDLAKDVEKKWYNRNTIEEPKNDGTATTDTTNTLTSGGRGGGSSVDRIVGSSKQIRNITVNIDAFNKGGINTQNTSLQKMGASELEQWFTDMCLRVVRNLETSY